LIAIAAGVGFLVLRRRRRGRGASEAGGGGATDGGYGYTTINRYPGPPSELESFGKGPTYHEVAAERTTKGSTYHEVPGGQRAEELP
jgi:hypothetical protein